MKLAHSKLTNEQTQKMLEHFVAGTSARTVAEILQINKNTALLFYQKIRILIAKKLDEENHLLFKRINFAPEKLALNSIFLKTVLENLPNKKKSQQIPLFVVILREKKIHVFYPQIKTTFDLSDNQNFIMPDAIFFQTIESNIINANNIHLYRVFSDTSFKEGQRSAIDSIENFWKLTKLHWLKSNGIPLKNFLLFLKEAEWRYNYKKPKNLLNTLSCWINT
ncbi:MAG: hypothetical protein ACRYGR_10680 [Janthinobacterium lividum]